jgi:hypothetical protein
MCHLFAHLWVCVSQAGLEPRSGDRGSLLFSQCNVAWRSFVWAGSQGVGVLLLLGVFFCQVWLHRFSKIFDLRSSHCLLPPSSCHLGFSSLSFVRVTDFLCIPFAGLESFLLEFFCFFFNIYFVFKPEILSSTCSSLLKWLSAVFFIYFEGLFISRIFIWFFYLRPYICLLYSSFISCATFFILYISLL